MGTIIHILLLEDDANDATLIQAKLRGADLSCSFTRAQKRDEFETLLGQGKTDIILADYRLPDYDGISALRLAKELCPEVPFIFVSGAMGEEAAIEALTQGAIDYVLKHNLSRLAPAVRRALQEAGNRRERKLAEEALQVSNNLLGAIIEAAPVAIIGLDLEGRVQSVWNPAAKKMLGWSAREVMGRPLPTIPAGHQKEELRCFREKARKGLALNGLEVRRQRRDSATIDYSIYASPLYDAQGRINGNLAVLVDTTERKKTEQQVALMSFALNGIHEAALMVDEKAGVRYVNEEACRLLGYSRDELLTMTVMDINPELSIERWPRQWKNFKDRGAYTLEGEIRSKDGRIFPVAISANYFEYEGRSFGIGLVRDITERKQAERERRANLYFFESMDRINRTIQGARDIETMMSDALDAVLSILDCDRAYLMHPCDPKADSWTVPMERCKPEYPGILTQGLVLPMTPEVAESIRIILNSDGPVKFGPGSDLPLPVEVSERFGLKCFMTMALYPKVGKPWQFGIQQCSHARIWTPEEERIFQEVGRRLADGLTSWLTFRNLEKSEARYRRIVDTANEGIWMMDAEFRTTFVNDQMARMLGYPVQEMTGRPITDFMHELEIADQYEKQEARRQGEAENYERRFRCKDGRILWALVAATPVFDDDHQFKGSFAMVTDITAKKLAEDDLYRLNRELECRVEERTRELAASHAELEKAYQDLKTAHTRMLQQEKMASIGQLAAGVAHEINNPLAYVISNLGTLSRYAKEIGAFVSTLEDGVRSSAAENSDAGAELLARVDSLRQSADLDFILDDIEQIVAESLDGSERMKQIVQNLKSFARLDEETCKMADLNEGLESTLKIVSNELKYKAAVSKSYGDLPETLCNPGQLNQVFMNLLVNAAQSIEHQGQIDIQTRLKGDFIVIEIADTGCGIPEDKLNRIFEPFFTTKGVGKGTGLGLSIVYDIVEKHGGEIAVQSRHGRGTRFTVSLPVRAETEKIQCFFSSRVD